MAPTLVGFPPGQGRKGALVKLQLCPVCVLQRTVRSLVLKSFQSLPSSQPGSEHTGPEHMFRPDLRLLTFLHPLSHLIRTWKGKQS